MPTLLSWPLVPDAPIPDSSGGGTPSTAQTQAAEAAARGVPTFIGRGIRRPFTRDKKNDFATAEGLELVQANLVQAIGTKGPTATTQGEVPWRTEFGSRLHVMRHRNNTDAMRSFATAVTREAAQQWEPRARVTRTDVLPSARPRELLVRSKFEVVERNGRVVAPGLDVEVPITTE